MFRALTVEGLEPNTVTYSTLIAALARGGQTDMALEAFARMCAAGVRPNAHTYNSLLHACTSGPGRWERCGRYSPAIPPQQWMHA